MQYVNFTEGKTKIALYQIEIVEYLLNIIIYSQLVNLFLQDRTGSREERAEWINEVGAIWLVDEKSNFLFCHWNLKTFWPQISRHFSSWHTLGVVIIGWWKIYRKFNFLMKNQLIDEMVWLFLIKISLYQPSPIHHSIFLLVFSAFETFGRLFRRLFGTYWKKVWSQQSKNNSLMWSLMYLIS